MAIRIAVARRMNGSNEKRFDHIIALRHHLVGNTKLEADTVQNIVAWLDRSPENQMFTLDPIDSTKRVEVKVARGFTSPYLHTVANGKIVDNLLQLPLF